MHTSPKSRFRKKVLLILVCMIAAVVLINQITVYPFIWSFRFVMSLTGQQGNPGDYDDLIDTVEEVARVTVPVNGYPDASFAVYRPKKTKKELSAVVFIHGGGWSLGNADAISWFVKLLSSNGYVVCNVDYALSPENTYPASTCQHAEVVNYIYEHAEEYGIDHNNIFIGGNSAGAHLSSQLGALFTDSVYKQEMKIDTRVPREAISGLLLFNGVYNFDTAEDCCFFAFEKWAWSYTGKKEYRSYEYLDEMSTVKHITLQYPSTFITVGDVDPLEPQTKEFVQKLSAEGVDHTALFWTGTGAGLNHDYIYEMNTEHGQIAYEMVLEFMEKHIRDQE